MGQQVTAQPSIVEAVMVRGRLVDSQLYGLVSYKLSCRCLKPPASKIKVT
jgi:hypothetical protein